MAIDRKELHNILDALVDFKEALTLFGDALGEDITNDIRNNDTMPKPLIDVAKFLDCEQSMTFGQLQRTILNAMSEIEQIFASKGA